MNPFVEPSDAAHVLAVAAYKVVQRWSDGDLATAVRGLSEALDYFANARPTIVPTSTQSTTKPSTMQQPIEPPRRFKSALSMIEPRAQNVVALANGILAACEEIALEHTMPTNDPAVQLLAAHLAWVCDINVGSDDSAALIRECHLRSKTRLNES